jgi:hypothetical protein
VSLEDARRLAAARAGTSLKIIPGMNHVLKQAETPQAQQAAYTDPSLPIDPRAVDEIVSFLKLAFGDDRRPFVAPAR